MKNKKNFSGTRLARVHKGSQKELVFGSRVTRLSGTSRAYVLLGSVISALFIVPYIKCDICGPSFQLKAVIVNIAIHN